MQYYERPMNISFDTLFLSLDRFVKYSIENGDSEDEVLSTLEKKGRDAIDIYLGGKIDDDLGRQSTSQVSET